MHDFWIRGEAGCFFCTPKWGRLVYSNVEIWSLNHGMVYVAPWRCNVRIVNMIVSCAELYTINPISGIDGQWNQLVSCTTGTKSGSWLYVMALAFGGVRRSLSAFTESQIWTPLGRPNEAELGCAYYWRLCKLSRRRLVGRSSDSSWSYKRDGSRETNKVRWYTPRLEGDVGDGTGQCLGRLWTPFRYYILLSQRNQ